MPRELVLKINSTSQGFYVLYSSIPEVLDFLSNLPLGICVQVVCWHPILTTPTFLFITFSTNEAVAISGLAYYYNTHVKVCRYLQLLIPPSKSPMWIFIAITPCQTPYLRNGLLCLLTHFPSSHQALSQLVPHGFQMHKSMFMNLLKSFPCLLIAH